MTTNIYIRGKYKLSEQFRTVMTTNIYIRGKYKLSEQFNNKL